jgi:hypothetical protein
MRPAGDAAPLSCPFVGMRSLRQAAMKASRSQMMEWVLPWTSQSMARRRGASMLRGIHGS